MRNRKFLMEPAENLEFYLIAMELVKTVARYWLNPVFKSSTNQPDEESKKTFFWIKPLKETDLGVAQAFFDPWGNDVVENFDFMDRENETN